MKKLLPLIVASLLFTACTSSTKHGECIGILDEQDPAYRYSYSVWNIVLGIVFSETLVVPAIVIFGDLKCPVEAKAPK